MCPASVILRKSTVTRGWGPGGDGQDELPFPRWARKRGVTRDEIRAVERLRVRRQQNRGTQEELVAWGGSAWESRVRDRISQALSPSQWPKFGKHGMSLQQRWLGEYKLCPEAEGLDPGSDGQDSRGELSLVLWVPRFPL